MTWYVGLVDFSGESEVQQDGRCVSRYTRKYLVRTDAATFQTESQVATAVGINRGSALAADPNAICHKATVGPGPAMTRAPYLAYFATYEWATNATLPDTVNDDPTTRRTLTSISPTIQSTYITDYMDGTTRTVILDSAGQPFDGGIPVDVRMGTVTKTRNKDAAGYNQNNVLANCGKLNSVTYLGGLPGTVQVDISSSETYEGAFHFWKETFTFNYKRSGWQPKPLQAGFYHLVGGEPERILNSDIKPGGDSNECPEPQPLDDNGVIVSPTPANTRPTRCKFKTDIVYFESMDFSTFSL